MRTPGDRLQYDLVVIVRRVTGRTTSRGTSMPTETRTSVRAALQSLGDTGRRQDVQLNQMRQAGKSSWRIWFQSSDIAAAGLAYPFIYSGDTIEWNGYELVCRGKPIPQRRTRSGETLSWSIDVDGVE